ncbi:hypothetical protein MO973_27265 [Paenibacillus sp. TRM 82003]|nr:hypothetical protein [Paenibacillus sp. TRM 82003]
MMWTETIIAIVGGLLFIYFPQYLRSERAWFHREGPTWWDSKVTRFSGYFILTMGIIMALLNVLIFFYEIFFE